MLRSRWSGPERPRWKLPTFPGRRSFRRKANFSCPPCSDQRLEANAWGSRAGRKKIWSHSTCKGIPTGKPGVIRRHWVRGGCLNWMAPVQTSLPPRGPHRFRSSQRAGIDLLRYWLPGRARQLRANRFRPRPVNVYHFFATHIGEEPPGLTEELAHGDAAATSRAPRSAAERLANTLRSLDSSTRRSGQSPLKLMATGGIYLGGGIAPKLVTSWRGHCSCQHFSARSDATAARIDSVKSSPMTRSLCSERPL